MIGGAVRLLRAKLTALLRRDRLDADFDEELASHVAMAADDHHRRGLSADDARRAALLKLGGVEATRLLHRDTRGVPQMDTLVHDLRYTLRTLRREIGFAAIAVLILGIGIGANTAVFSLVNALLLRPLPFPHADRLVWIENSERAGSHAGGRAGRADPDDLSGRTSRALTFTNWRAHSRSFEELGGYMAFFNFGRTRLTVGTESEQLVDVGVTCTFYRTLGVQPALGRGFVDEECQDNGPKAVLLSHTIWERRFHADRSLIGRTITLNNQAATVVGVMPASFDFGSVFTPGTRVDLWSPFPTTTATDNWGNTLAIVGRLKPGVSMTTAETELNALANEQLRARGWRSGTYGARLRPLHDEVSGRMRTALIVLFAAVGAVLLIACANLSNLLLARAASRQQEIAVRTALGATRSRLIRQLLTESLVLSLCGAVLGLLIAEAATRGVTRLRGVNLPLLTTVAVDGTALAFAIGIAVLTGLIFGLVPALQMSGARPQDALKQQARGSSDGARAALVRRGLVVAEVALACTLLVTAGLLIRSFARVLDIDLGFRPERLALLRLDTPGLDDSPRRNAFYEEAVRRLEAVPGIESAAVSDALPFDRNRSWGLAAKGQVYPSGETPSAFVRAVSRGYFETMGIRIEAGQDFSGRETRDNEAVVILNETAARTLFPGQHAIGRTVSSYGSDFRVIGVVADVRHTALEETSGNEVYLAITRHGPAGSADLVVRTSLAPSALASSIRAALQPINPALPTADVRQMQDLVDRAVSPRRFVMWLLTAFAAQALILACLGIYGVVSYSVTERTREIGIRMALGASRGDVQRRVLRETLVLSAMGAALGLIGAFAAGQVIGSLLYGLSGTDPLTFAGMAAVLAAVALIAGYIPARRASRIDAMTALRIG